jgi:hypothetical protein
MTTTCTDREIRITIDEKQSPKLFVNGTPFIINGAGGSSHLELLIKCGGNSIRTWSIDQLGAGKDGKTLLDQAWELGILVTVGIWIEHERHGFDYNDRTQVEEQRMKVLEAVREFKNHPAILMWGLGNEMEGPNADGTDPRIWEEMNVLARIIKDEDPNHPVLTAIAGSSLAKVQMVKQYYTEVDVLGINAYGSASQVADNLKKAGWEKPYVLTEFGPEGYWEVEKTEWGATIEPSIQDKIKIYTQFQRMVMENTDHLCLGSYVLLWGQKQETTFSWFSMFLKSGEKLPTVDAISRLWTGEEIKNPCPIIESIHFPHALKKVEFCGHVDATASITARGDAALTYDWFILSESNDIRAGGDAEAEPPAHPECILNNSGNRVSLVLPRTSGAYRLFLVIRDGQGSACSANVPFYIV